MKRLVLLLIAFFSIVFANAKVTIEMEKDGGIYKVPCIVNGLRMKFIFDTGAANVCISESMANYMLENEYLNKNDILGVGKSSVADGRIVDHVRINLSCLEIGGLQLHDVEAVVITGQSAPLLLGQSAISKMGEVSISGNKLIIQDISNCSSEDIDKWSNIADSYYQNDIYDKALEYYLKIYDCDGLSDYGLFVLSECYYHIGKIQHSMEILHDLEQKIQNNTIDCSSYCIAQIYSLLATCYADNNNQAFVSYCDKALKYLSDENWNLITEIYWKVAVHDFLENDYLGAVHCTLNGIKCILRNKYPIVYNRWKQSNFSDDIVGIVDDYNWGYDKQLGDFLSILCAEHYLHGTPNYKLAKIASSMGSDLANTLRMY